MTSAPRLGGLVCALVLSGLVLSGTHAAPADPEVSARAVPTATTTFPGAGTGSIGDPGGSTTCGAGTGSTRTITFDVSNLPSTLADVSLSMTLAHDEIGDVSITLVAPNGAAAPVAVRPGATTSTGCGLPSRYGGTYTFDDRAAGTVWTANPAPDATLPGGSYRPSAALTGAVVPLTAAFGSLATPNGRWTLRVTDTTNNDVGGNISAASLTLVAQNRVPCQQATAAVVSTQAALTAAEKTLSKAKKKLRKLKRRGADPDRVAKALKKSRKAKKVKKAADQALDQALTSYYAVC